jgi:myosin-5
MNILRFQTVTLPMTSILAGFPSDQLDQTDLIQLPELHEAAILESLKLRYSSNKIYTYSGQVLVALNPYAALDALYGPDIMALYSKVGLPHPVPHIYALGEQAFRRMLQTSQPQSILIRSSFFFF